MATVEKEMTFYPLGNYKPVKIAAKECRDWNEVRLILKEDYLTMRDMLSEGDRKAYDKLLGVK